MSMQNAYDHWKQTNPDDDGSVEAIERIVASITASRKKLVAIDRSLDLGNHEQLVNDSFTALADAYPVLCAISWGKLTPALHQRAAAFMTSLTEQAARCNTLREETIAEAANEQFLNPDF